MSLTNRVEPKTQRRSSLKIVSFSPSRFLSNNSSKVGQASVKDLTEKHPDRPSLDSSSSNESNEKPQMNKVILRQRSKEAATNMTVGEGRRYRRKSAKEFFNGMKRLSR